MQLDLKGLAAGVVENNMGVDGIELRVRGAVANGEVRLAETGQTLPVRSGPAASSKPWLVLAVEGWEELEPLELVFAREQDGPGAL